MSILEQNAGMGSNSWGITLMAESLRRYLDYVLNHPQAMWILALLAGGLALFIITRGKWK